MEYDVVLSYKVDEARVLALPPFLPVVGQQLPRIGDVTNGSVEPDIHYFSLCAFHWYGDAPVQIAGHGARFQAHIKPTLTLAHHVGTPIGVVSKYPLLQPWLGFVERQVPMLCCAQYWF